MVNSKKAMRMYDRMYVNVLNRKWNDTIAVHNLKAQAVPFKQPAQRIKALLY